MSGRYLEPEWRERQRGYLLKRIAHTALELPLAESVEKTSTIPPREADASIGKGLFDGLEVRVTREQLIEFGRRWRTAIDRAEYQQWQFDEQLSALALLDVADSMSPATFDRVHGERASMATDVVGDVDDFRPRRSLAVSALS